MALRCRRSYQQKCYSILQGGGVVVSIFLYCPRERVTGVIPSCEYTKQSFYEGGGREG